MFREASRSTLAQLQARSRIGYAVNFLARSRVNGPEELYRTSPRQWVRFCEQDLGGRADVVYDYGLREFTLLVRTAADPGTAG